MPCCSALGYAETSTTMIPKTTSITGLATRLRSLGTSLIGWWDTYSVTDWLVMAVRRYPKMAYVGAVVLTVLSGVLVSLIPVTPLLKAAAALPVSLFVAFISVVWVFEKTR